MRKFLFVGFIALICFSIAACTPNYVVQRGDVYYSESIVGRWEFVSGSFIYYFASNGDIEFFADGRVAEFAFGEPGEFILLDDGRLRVVGDWFPTTPYYFTFSIDGDMLTITDHSDDYGTWRRY
ncbi:MAG: hypothetical protein FWF81_12580 [Defluviitaleaceae bacterium]|nr:hypothetical protein [Defluviitaleaceae bacterium]